MVEEINMVDVEVKEQVSNLIEAIKHSGDADEQTQTALTVCTLLAVEFTESSYAAIGALEIMKGVVIKFGKEMYSGEGNE